MAAKSSSRSPRPSWSGGLKFGLVTIPVQAFNAIQSSAGSYSFHQLHRECHSRIRYQKVCPIHGEVSNNEIISGYEYEKGRYVEIDKSELDEVRPSRDETLKLDHFIEPDEIDPVYFDGRMYYLLPDGGPARESYNVFHEALEKRGRWGVGQVVLSRKQQLAVVRPLDGLLHMALLNYDVEVRKPEDIAHDENPEAPAKEVQLAQTLIDAFSDGEFSYADYVNEYHERVGQLIEAKLEGEEVVVPAVTEDEPEVINLMDALKKSLEGQKKSASSRRKTSRRTAKKKGA